MKNKEKASVIQVSGALGESFPIIIISSRELWVVCRDGAAGRPQIRKYT